MNPQKPEPPQLPVSLDKSSLGGVQEVSSDTNALTIFPSLKKPRRGECQPCTSEKNVATVFSRRVKTLLNNAEELYQRTGCAVFFVAFSQSGSASFYESPPLQGSWTAGVRSIMSMRMCPTAKPVQSPSQIISSRGSPSGVVNDSMPEFNGSSVFSPIAPLTPKPRGKDTVRGVLRDFLRHPMLLGKHPLYSGTAPKWWPPEVQFRNPSNMATGEMRAVQQAAQAYISTLPASQQVGFDAKLSPPPFSSKPVSVVHTEPKSPDKGSPKADDDRLRLMKPDSHHHHHHVGDPKLLKTSMLAYSPQPHRKDDRTPPHNKLVVDRLQPNPARPMPKSGSSLLSLTPNSCPTITLATSAEMALPPVPVALHNATLSSSPGMQRMLVPGTAPPKRKADGEEGEEFDPKRPRPELTMSMPSPSDLQAARLSTVPPTTTLSGPLTHSMHLSLPVRTPSAPQPPPQPHPQPPQPPPPQQQPPSVHAHPPQPQHAHAHAHHHGATPTHPPPPPRQPQPQHAPQPPEPSAAPPPPTLMSPSLPPSSS